MANPAILVYSVATGRLRRFHYETGVAPNVLAFLNSCPAYSGEAKLVYNPTGSEGTAILAACQAAVNAHTGKSVSYGIDAGDTYAVIDSQNNIVHVGFFDPACNDPVCGDAAAYPGCTLILAPAGCSMGWTYNGTTFSPPVFVTKSP